MSFVKLMLALVLGLFATALPAVAAEQADLPHVHVQLMVLPSSLQRGHDAQAGLYFKLESGWHVYWMNPGDAGEPPHVQWTLPRGISAGKLQFPTPKRLPLGPLMDFGYEDEVLFPFTLKADNSAANGPATLHAKVDWLVCRATCIPEKTELELTRSVSEQAAPTADAQLSALFSRFQSQIPRPVAAGTKTVFQPTATGFNLQVDTGQPETTAQFFPAEADILSNPAPQQVITTAHGFVLELTKDAALANTPAQLKGVVALSGGRAFEIAAVPGTVSATGTRQPLSSPNATSPAAGSRSAAPQRGLIEIVALAFFGGLLLNLMPCVFPVLFLKGLALVQSGHEDRGRMRAHGFVYAAGILVSFWALVALLLGLRAAGSTLGWGFQFQSPVFLTLIAGLLFFLGLSLAGQFEIGLTLTSAGGSLAQKQGLTGSFFTGVLAVIVATPCTAPFMGVAIGYALAQPALVTFAVFTALALGLAVPYVLLTLQPAWTRILPRPGAWMEVLRQAISVPIFATVIWLAWVLAQAYGAAVLAALLTAFLLLAIAGWFLGRWPAQRWATVCAGCILVAVVAFCIVAPGKLAAAPEPASGAAPAQGAWEPWSAEAVSRYQAQGRPVFVDFTASWCLSCQVNERVALHDDNVRKAFADAKVALLRADWTRHDEAITQTLAALGRSGVPAYAVYAPGQPQPQLLPEVLTPGIVIDAVRSLKRGK